MFFTDATKDKKGVRLEGGTGRQSLTKMVREVSPKPQLHFWENKMQVSMTRVSAPGGNNPNPFLKALQHYNSGCSILRKLLAFAENHYCESPETDRHISPKPFHQPM